MARFFKPHSVGMALAVVAALACQSSDDDASGEHGSVSDNDGRGPSAGRADAGTSQGSPSSPDGTGLPTEQEVALGFDAPQAGLSALYVPNPVTNRVAVVDAKTFAIESLAVGSQPTYAATVPGQDLAVVLNVGSRDAALLRTEQGVTRVQRLAIGHDANAIAVAPGGAHAVVFLDGSTSTAGAQSFQDVTVIDLARGAERAHRVSVGFRPRGVQFSADGARAFVITEDGISIVDFAALSTGPTIARLVGLGDVAGGAQSVDVQVTPDGAFALARREGESTLRLVTLADGSVETLALASAVPGEGEPALTDLDVASDGRYAVVVLRARSAIVRIPLPAGFRDATTLAVRTVPDQLIGSLTLARTGKRAVAYTTAAPVESLVLIDDIEAAGPVRSVILRKSVRAVALSDDGARALVLHAAVAAQGDASDDARIDAAEGYSVVDATSGFVKLQLTSARLRERDLLITPDRSRLFALQRDDAKAVRAVSMIDLGSFQITDLALTKPPVSLGFLPGLARVFVGQAGEGGLITFLDAQSGARLRDLSGFEIASKIRL
ncbi:MAG: hypothetical protein ABW252_10835 [Polyangiales bacterium]